MQIIKKYGVFISLLFGLLALVMIFINGAVSFKTLTPLNYKSNLFSIIFGRNNFLSRPLNLVGFVALFFLLIGLAVSFITVLPEKVRYGFSALILTISGVMFFLVPLTVVYAKELNGPHGIIGTPLILAAVFTFIAVAVNIFLVILHKDE